MPIVQEVVSRMSFMLNIETDMPAIEGSVLKNRFEQEGAKLLIYHLVLKIINVSKTKTPIK